MEPAEVMPITVAIVEDDAPLRASLSGILQRAANCRCVGAFASAEDALREIPGLSPQVVLMDLRMPVLGGVEATRRIRRLGGRAAEAPIVAMTANVMQGEQERLLQAGFDAYIGKPIDIEDIPAWLRGDGGERIVIRDSRITNRAR